MAHNLPAKRKKSGSENRKTKISKEKENKQLSSFMLNYLKTKDNNERATPCSNKTEESNSQLLPDSLPENLANADCFEGRNESEVQWNPSKADIIGAKKIVRFIEMSAL